MLTGQRRYSDVPTYDPAFKPPVSVAAGVGVVGGGPEKTYLERQPIPSTQNV